MTKLTRGVEGHPDRLLQEVGPVDGERLDLGLPRPRRRHVELARSHVRREDLVVVTRHEAHLALLRAAARAVAGGEELDPGEGGAVFFWSVQ